MEQPGLGQAARPQQQPAATPTQIRVQNETESDPALRLAGTAVRVRARAGWRA
jgi:hypothetical protein